MPHSPGSQSDVPAQQFEGADFGANEWLVEEMFDQYQQDPDSVDATWAEYFRATGSGAGTNGTSQPAARASAPAQPAAAPAPKPAQQPAQQA
ncbi:hypothetical protein, partial [Nocardioides sp. XL1]